jgi:ADP-heptose:LPS heptosyltransferase
MKPKLLVIECWGLGDLAIASPFLQAACERFAVTLLAKPYALDLQDRFWPDVKVVPFKAPWTVFRGKYRLLTWAWPAVLGTLRQLSKERFDCALSARWDPRDHLLLRVVGARQRLGFPRAGSGAFLTHRLERPAPAAHHYEHWRVLALACGLEIPPRSALLASRRRRPGGVIIHTGAAQPVRVWPLPRYLHLARQLRAAGHAVRLVCDPEQRAWWLAAGEPDVATPLVVRDLLEIIDASACFIGNDSGPGHLAAFCGLPTFTIFGPQLPEWFAPLHPDAQVVEGKPCPYKPCSDYCRFPVAHCIQNLDQESVTRDALAFVGRWLNRPALAHAGAT